jgi:hypothetical protein
MLNHCAVEWSNCHDPTYHQLDGTQRAVDVVVGRISLTGLGYADGRAG